MHAETQLRRDQCGGGARRVLRFIDEAERLSNRPRQTLVLPLHPAGEMAKIEFSAPMEPAEWDQLMRLFEVLRPGMVKEPKWKPRTPEEKQGVVSTKENA